MRTIDFRWKILRGGADYAWLRSAADSAPTMWMRYDAEIKTSFSGLFAPTATDIDGRTVPVNWQSDELSPLLVIDGVEHPLGIYMPATVTPSKRDGVETVRVEAYDRCWRVRDDYAESMPYFAAGTPYITVIEILLTNAGIETVYATPNEAVLAEDREWEIGTSSLSIVNELLSEINYKPLWFNAYGAAVLEPAAVPLVQNIRHTLDADKIESLVLPTISRETDVYAAPNVFIVACANPDKSGNMVASAENTNPQSPLSIARRGRRVAKYTQLQNIADQAELQAYADRLRNESMITGETIRVSTALLPGFGVADVVALHYGDLAAICIERTWTMELRVGGTMTHTLEKVVYNVG